MMHNAPGVDLNNPHDDPEEFPSNAVPVWTQKERRKETGVGLRNTAQISLKLKKRQSEF
jgi:hypothetical protein